MKQSRLFSAVMHWSPPLSPSGVWEVLQGFPGVGPSSLVNIEVSEFKFPPESAVFQVNKSDLVLLPSNQNLRPDLPLGASGA